MVDYLDTVHRQLELLYTRYHRKEFISPDPLELVLRYKRSADREIAGFIASSLALGRVQCILQAAEQVLSRFENLKNDLLACSQEELRALFDGFSYRFFTGEHISSLLWGIKKVVQNYGSLESCFLESLKPGDATVIPALCTFINSLSGMAEGTAGMLLTSPENKSACKRHLLYLRWMVRQDDIDPGGWSTVLPALLVVPVDTHMLRMSRKLGLTARRQADLKAALEITERLRQYSPEDPVKYDFSMTRPGIHPDLRS